MVSPQHLVTHSLFPYSDILFRESEITSREMEILSLGKGNNISHTLGILDKMSRESEIISREREIISREMEIIYLEREIIYLEWIGWFGLTSLLI